MLRISDDARKVLSTLRELQIDGRERLLPPRGQVEALAERHGIELREAAGRLERGTQAKVWAAERSVRRRFDPVPEYVLQAELRADPGHQTECGSDGTELVRGERLSRGLAELKARGLVAEVPLDRLDFCEYVTPAGGVVLVRLSTNPQGLGFMTVKNGRDRWALSTVESLRVDGAHPRGYRLAGDWAEVLAAAGGRSSGDAGDSGDGAGQAEGDEPSTATNETLVDGGGPPRHSPDFRSVFWRGQTFTFTANQAAAVAILWKAADQGTPDVGDAYVLEQVDSESTKLQNTFRSRTGAHPAWGTLVIPGKSKGTHRLAT